MRYANYWHKHPRGFSNECNLVRVETPGEAMELMDAGYSSLSYAEAREHVRWINAENDAWGSNRAFGRMEMPPTGHGRQTRSTA